MDNYQEIKTKWHEACRDRDRQTQLLDISIEDSKRLLARTTACIWDAKQKKKELKRKCEDLYIQLRKCKLTK